MEILKQIEDNIRIIQNIPVILDSDVAMLYNVETKRINEAVANNPDKFPSGFILTLAKNDMESLRSKISSTKLSKTRTIPKAFTEKGLYMLATILKSPRATETTIAIIETFTKIRELGRGISKLSDTTNEKDKKKLMRRSGELISSILSEDLKLNETETTFEINFAVLKFKHTIKAKKER